MSRTPRLNVSRVGKRKDVYDLHVCQAINCGLQSVVRSRAVKRVSWLAKEMGRSYRKMWTLFGI